LEAVEPFTTLANFPARKPIFTYPTSFVPHSTLQVRAGVKEELVAELRDQVRAHGIAVTPGRVERIERAHGLLQVHLAGTAPIPARRVLVAVGRSGEFRRLGVSGESLPHVFNRLHDPK